MKGSVLNQNNIRKNVLRDIYENEFSFEPKN